MVDHTGMIIPLVLYFILIMGIALWGSRTAGKRSDTKGFMEEYFIGRSELRSMEEFLRFTNSELW